MKHRPRARGFTLIELMIVISIIAILAAILVPNFIRARAMGQLTTCKSNLRNIATGVEMYSVDNGARYPGATTGLTPNYLKTMPECPVSGSDTYTPSYSSATEPDSFELYCSGNNHVPLAIPPDYPRWDSDIGLVERAP